MQTLAAIIDYALSANGLEISFEHDGEEHFIELAPFATCELFRKLGIIEGYDTYACEPVVLFEAQDAYEDEYGSVYRKTGTAWLYWADYVKECTLTRKEAEIIARHHITDKYFKRILSDVGLLDQRRAIA